MKSTLCRKVLKAQATFYGWVLGTISNLVRPQRRLIPHRHSARRCCRVAVVMERFTSAMRNGRRVRLRMIAVAAAVIVFFPPGAATPGVGSQNTALRVFTTRSIATVLEKIGADFERRTGRTLSVTTDVAARMVRRINDGEPFDFLVAAPAQIDELIEQGKIIPDTRIDLARSGIGVAVRAGAPKPDVSSVAAFKRALLTARSVAYLKEGQSGVYVAGVLERLGIAETIRSKVTLPETDIVSELVSRGDIELGIVVITQIVTTEGVALAGPLPSEIQSYITFTGGISANSTSIDVAKDLMAVLRSPVAISIMRSQGDGARCTGGGYSQGRRSDKGHH